MALNFEITNVTHNKINFKWMLGSMFVTCNKYRMPPFSLIPFGGNIVPFNVDATLSNNEIRITVQQSTTRTGRAMVTFVTRGSDSGSLAATTSFIEYWAGAQCFRITSPLILDESILIGCITWLGFADKTQELNITLRDILSIVPFDNKLIPDFRIVVEDQEIPAHKAILARHSSVLLAMVQEQMKEAKENQVIIEDVTAVTMEIILGIIYRGDTTKLSDVDTALKVLVAAEKYQMLQIKSICESALQVNLRDDNVLAILEAADMHNAKELCETCIDYIIIKREKIISAEDLKKMCQNKRNILMALLNWLLYKL